MMMVDDINVLFDLMKIFGGYGSCNTTQLQEFEFLSKWNQLSVEEKLKKYEKFSGHELNLFLYFKDRNFFDNVCKKYLPSKREKQFIDHFVLENTKYFENLLETNQLEHMSIEKIV